MKHILFLLLLLPRFVYAQLPEAEYAKDKGIVLMNQGKLDEAIVEFNYAINLLKDNCQLKHYLYVLRGGCRFESGQGVLGSMDFTMAINMTWDYSKSDLPDHDKYLHEQQNKLAYYYRGKFYFSRGNTTSACEDWNKAKELGDEESADLINQHCK